MKYKCVGFSSLFLIILFSVTKYVNGDVITDLHELNTELEKIQSAITDAQKLGESEKLHALLLHLSNFKLRALQKINQHEVFTIEDESIQRQIHLYTHIGKLFLPENIRTTLHEIQKNADRHLLEYFNTFENFVFTTDIFSSKRDIELQMQWKLFSEFLGNYWFHVFDTHFGIIEGIASNTVFGDPLSLWSYVTGEDQLPSIQELKNLWHNKLKKPYRQLFSLLQNDFSDIFTLYTEDPDTPGPLPAYLYDIIHNTYAGKTNAIYKNTKLFQKLQNRSVITVDDPARFRRMGTRTMTKKGESFFKSLGFPRLDGFFQMQSEFKTMVESGQPIIRAYYYSSTEYLIDATGPTDSLTFYYIHKGLYEIYRKLILDSTQHPSIFKEPNIEPFFQAFGAAVIMSSVSFNRLVVEGFMKPEQITEQLKHEYFRGEAIKVFSSLASAMAAGTWKRDVLSGYIDKNNIICELWNHRYQYEGVKPTTATNLPVNTGLLFDTYSKSYITGEEITFKHFTGIILQYQIFARLCQLAGEYNPDDPFNPPLHLCDITGSHTAGDIILRVLREGSSKNWHQLLDIIFDTPNTPLSANGLLDFFAPFFVNAPDVPESLSENVWDEAVNFCENYS